MLSAWSGRGDLLATLAASLSDDFAERTWTALNVRRRAHRILLQSLAPALSRWPRTQYAWLDALPAETRHRRERSPSVVAGVDWVSTRIRAGWPPRAFEVRTRERTPHTLLLSTLRWTLDRLAEVRDDAFQVEPAVVAAVMPQLGIALALLEEEPLASVLGERPAFEDLRALAREGRPWSLVAAVAKEVLAVESSPELWAMRLVAPDPELRPTLFHLGVLGSLLVAARELGGTLTSRTPLTGVGSRPAYTVQDHAGAAWDVWFEAGGVWSRYGRPSPYVDATAALAEAGVPIKPDLMLMRLDDAALVLECKYSSRIGTVGRAGVTQALAYAVEARSRLADRVEAYVVAPDDVVTTPTQVATEVGPVGIITPAHLKTTLAAFWA